MLKRLLLVFFLASPVLAGTNTTNLNLYKPAVGETGWGTSVNNNFDIIDSSMVTRPGSNAFTGYNSFTSSVAFSSSTFNRIWIATPTYTISGDKLAVNGIARIGGGVSGGTAYVCDQSFSNCSSLTSTILLVTSSTISNMTNSTTTINTLLTASSATVTSLVVSTATITNLVGTTGATNAFLGNYGEYISSATGGATNAPTSPQYGDLVSITLTRGDWDVTFESVFSKGAATSTTGTMAIATTSGNSSDAVLGDSAASFDSTSDLFFPIVISNNRRSLSGTTTLYGKMSVAYTVGTPQFYGRLSARRIR